MTEVRSTEHFKAIHHSFGFPDMEGGHLTTMTPGSTPVSDCIIHTQLKQHHNHDLCYVLLPNEEVVSVE